LGIRPKDFDVATNAKPQEVQRLFRRARVIGRRFQIVHVMFGSDTIETSTFRAMHGVHNEVDEHGRVLRDNEFGRQDEDAARRDFTINAMYYDPKTQTVWDYHNGMQDLRAGLLRMIGDPALRYREDPVRMLRVVRFQAKLRLKIEPATQAPMAHMAGLLSNVPPSRLFDEMLKLLCSGSALACLQSLRAAGLHLGVFPLLDVILDQPRTQRFIEQALARTDARVHEGKPISPGFLFATLMWHLVQDRWEQRQTEGELKYPALFGAIEDVLHQHAERTAIPKRITGDMREIWAFQPRFEKRQGKSAFLFLEQLKFRAGLDFLELRAEAGEVASELAQWWRNFSDGDPNQRQHLLDTAQSTGPASPNKRRRRKRSSSGSTETSNIHNNTPEHGDD
jgi:poly(A) polymerase